MMLRKALGVDVGNGYTKYKGGKFASKVDVGTLEEPHGEVHAVTFRGMDYIVGSTNGAKVIEEDKYFSENYLILLLTGIALSCKDAEEIDAYVTVGVPANQYNKAFREKIKQHLKGINENIIVDGVKYTIYLDEVEVGMEGCVVFKTNDTETVLGIDVGAGTINAVLWKNKRRVYDYTFDKSFKSLHIEMSDVLKKKYSFRQEPEKMEQYVGAEYVKIKGLSTEVPELKKLLENFIATCSGTIQRNEKLEWQSCDKIVIFGGGAEKTFPYFKKAFPHAEPIENSQFINQEVYEMISRAKFNGI